MPKHRLPSNPEKGILEPRSIDRSHPSPTLPSSRISPRNNSHQDSTPPTQYGRSRSSDVTASSNSHAHSQVHAHPHIAHNNNSIHSGIEDGPTASVTNSKSEQISSNQK